MPNPSIKNRSSTARLRLRIPPSAAYLDETCSGNDSLRAEIEALLQHDSDAGSFLAHPADEFLATIASRAFETVHEDAVGVKT